MPLMWWEYALIAAILASVLLILGGLAFGFVRVRVQKWIGGALGRFMQNLAEQAAEEEGSGSPPGASGALSLGGFKIDPQLIQLVVDYGPQLLKLAQQFGLVKGGGGGGTNPFLKL